MPRNELLTRTFVELADTLVDDFDLVDLLTLLAERCVDILDVGAAGLMLASTSGKLQVVASSSDAMRVLELLEVQAEEGPCPDCFRSGSALLNQPLHTSAQRWPQFTPRALEAGFQTVSALPMRLRDTVIGALNMFRVDSTEMSAADVTTAQAFADVATIAILQHRATREAQILNEQLTEALNSRVIIEQAKGIVADREGVAISEAFLRLRAHARNHNLLLADLARAIVEGTTRTDTLRE